MFLALCQAYTVMFFMSIVEKLATIILAMRRANPARATENGSVLFAFGYTLSLITNPRYFADSNYMKTVDDMRLTPILFTLFVAIFCIQGLSLYLTRNDKEDAADLAADPNKWTDPDLAANRKPIFLLRTIGFMLACGTWSFMGIVINISVFMATGKGVAAVTWFFLMLVIMSFGYGLSCAFSFSAAQVRRKGDHITLSQSPA